MKATKIIAISLITSLIADNMFGGGAEDVVIIAIDVGGYVNSAAEAGAAITGNDLLKDITKSTETIATVSNMVDIASLSYPGVS